MLFLYRPCPLAEQSSFFVYPGANPGAKVSSIPVTEDANQVRFAADGLTIAFLTQGPRRARSANWRRPSAN